MNKPKAVLFDLGDTVLEYNYNNPEDAVKKILEVCENPYDIKSDKIQSFIEKISKEIFFRRDETCMELNFASLQRIGYEYFNISFKRDMHEIEKIFLKYAYKAAPSRNIVKLFNKLHENNIKYAALSNFVFSKEALKYELELYGLKPDFDFIISSADYGIRKPNRVIFELAQRKLGVDSGDIWFIGDSIKYDIIGARNAEMVPIWYNRKNAACVIKKDFIEIKDMQEIIDMIE